MSHTKEENEMIGVIAQHLLNDMAATSNSRSEIAESVGFHKGYESGYDAGYAAAQRHMRRAMVGVEITAGYQGPQIN